MTNDTPDVAPDPCPRCGALRRERDEARVEAAMMTSSRDQWQARSEEEARLVNSLAAQNGVLEAERDEARAEVERMMPVVEAAIKVNETPTSRISGPLRVLDDAVEAYLCDNER